MSYTILVKIISMFKLIQHSFTSYHLSSSIRNCYDHISSFDSSDLYLWNNNYSNFKKFLSYFYNLDLKTDNPSSNSDNSDYIYFSYSMIFLFVNLMSDFDQYLLVLNYYYGEVLSWYENMYWFCFIFCYSYYCVLYYRILNKIFFTFYIVSIMRIYMKIISFYSSFS
jgi:hypothetical protein